MPEGCHCFLANPTGKDLAPIICADHLPALHKAEQTIRSPKYEKWFDSMEAATAEARAIYDRWHPAGYGTIAMIFPISKWWQLRAWWAASCE